MSEDAPRRRLPIAGAPASGASDPRLGSRGPDVAAEPAPEAARLSPSFPMIAVVPALPEADHPARAQALAFVRAALARGVCPAVLLVARGASGLAEAEALADDPFVAEGCAHVHVVAAEASRAGEAVKRALEALEGERLVVALGADVLAFARPTFAVLVDRGAPILGYGAMARSIRDRADAVVAEAREGWADRVVSAVLSNSGGRP